MSKQYRVKQDCWDIQHQHHFEAGMPLSESEHLDSVEGCVGVSLLWCAEPDMHIHKSFLEELPPTVEGPKAGDLFEVIRVTEGTRPLIGDRVAHHLIAADSNYAFCKSPSTGTLERLKRDNLKPYTPPSEAPKFKPGDRVVTVRDAMDCDSTWTIPKGTELTIKSGTCTVSCDESRVVCERWGHCTPHLLPSDLTLVETPKEDVAPKQDGLYRVIYRISNLPLNPRDIVAFHHSASSNEYAFFTLMRDGTRFLLPWDNLEPYTTN